MAAMTAMTAGDWKPRFLDAACAMVHPIVRDWLPESRTRDNCAAEIDAAFARLERPVRPEYKPRLLALAGPLAGHAIIIAERKRQQAVIDSSWTYRGMSERIYADVAHRTFEITEPAHLRALLDAAAREFPKAEEIRLNRTAGAPELAPMVAEVVGSSSEPDMVHNRRLLAAPVRVVAALPPAPGSDRVVCEKATSLDFYDEYAREYGRMLEDRADLAPEIPIESPGDMQGYLAEGLLFLFRMDGRLGGVMAARRAQIQGMHGYKVWEKFLFESWRGRGLAVAAQRAFYRSLDGADDRIVFGHIHPRNGASLKAAMKDGRVDVSGYTFVRIPREVREELAG